MSYGTRNAWALDESDVANAEIVVPPPVVAAPSNSSKDNRSQVTWRELLAVVLLVLLADVTIYRGHGSTGLAVLLALAPWLLVMGSAPTVRRHRAAWWIGVLSALLTAKLIWSGSILAWSIGFILLVAFSMTQTGLCPYVVTTFVYSSQIISAGYKRLVAYSRYVNRLGPIVSRIAWLSFLLPLAALVIFGFIFILANPDLMQSVWSGAERFLSDLTDWIAHASFGELTFCFAALWIGAGLLRPLLTDLTADGSSPFAPPQEDLRAAPAPLYPAFRNTLLVVIALFAVYLVFEFQSLWFRVFPEGFHYSGYAHRGAAWLTIALALATGMLSLIFRGDVLRDPRLPFLKKLSWIWSAQNLVLAIAAFHRLYIYIGFNGLTQMRIIGMFGTATVVAGLILVLWKIANRKDFAWLIHRQLWALALAVYLYAITPVDAIWVSYNVRRVLAGDPAPSVELSVHPIGPEGILFLKPLMHCQDPIIREGIRAMLAEELEEAEVQFRKPERQHWTAYQIADHLVLRRLRADSATTIDYRDPIRRRAALDAFHQYAYQWY
jgi:hypothetical protein